MPSQECAQLVRLSERVGRFGTTTFSYSHLRSQRRFSLLAMALCRPFPVATFIFQISVDRGGYYSNDFQNHSRLNKNCYQAKHSANLANASKLYVNPTLQLKLRGLNSARLFATTYAGTYFGIKQAIHTDSIIASIHRSHSQKEITPDEQRWCFIALGRALLKIANSTGHFAQYSTSEAGTTFSDT